MNSTERNPIKGRLFLALPDRIDADQLARELDAKGWLCVVAAEERDHGVSRIRDSKPVAVIIDGSRVLDVGIAIAAAVRADSSTRAIPIIFIQTSKAVDLIKTAVPEAIFASRGALDYLLDKLAERPRAS